MAGNLQVGDWVETRDRDGRLVQGSIWRVLSNGKVNVEPQYAVKDNGGRLELIPVAARRRFNVMASRCEYGRHPFAVEV